ncbi:hypothetical protein [Ruminococcus sp.]|uniref:hypothetical protein n=1 Tax=Ruminococcus sp. TaxID=41978 RepID=UPI0025CFCA61|nr:hypothetical protein [Ruminococcus sp.]MBR1432528.1 hypothetical protein [Ruminococcus sp.]
MNDFELKNEEKVLLADQIALRYYNHNFGTMLKADIDTLIFSVYIEHCLNNGLPYDDYTLSIQLGITEAKVRTLKERKQLQYPYKGYNWKKEFVRLIPNAKYNDVKKLVQLNIGDVNLLKDVRNFVYNQGWYDEFQLNPKLFQCRLDFFISLCSKLEDAVEFDNNAHKALLALGKNEKEKSVIESIVKSSFQDGIKELVINGSKALLVEVLRTIPFSGLAATAINALISIII